MRDSGRLVEVEAEAGGGRGVVLRGLLYASDKGVPSAVKSVDPLRRQTHLPREQVTTAMTGRFRRRYGLTDSALTSAELQAAGELARVKFDSQAWTARLP